MRTIEAADAACLLPTRLVATGVHSASAIAHRSYLIRSAAVGLLLIQAACGSSGPSKEDIKDALIRQAKDQIAAMDSANQQLAATGLVPSTPSVMSKLKRMTVTDAACTAKDNGVFACVITVNASGQTATNNASFRRVNGVWSVIG